MATIIAPSTFRDFRCAEFNGVDEYMIGDPAASVRDDTAGAWSMWIRIPATFTANAVQFSLGCGSTGTARMNCGVRRIATTGTGTFFSWTYVNNAGTTYGYSATTTALAANTWYHIVFQSTGTAWECYINGVAQTLTSWTGPGVNVGDWFGDMTGTTPKIVAGVNYATGAVGTTFFAGRLNEFVYFTGRALTAGEVTVVYNGGTPVNPNKLPFASDVAAWWRFGDSRDSAITMFDEIGTNDLTLVNMDATNYVNV